MRVKTRSKYIIAFSLIFLLAVFLFSFALSVGSASADSSVTYLAAEVTTSSGDFIPSGFVYDKTAVSLGKALYTSNDASAWTRDDTLSAKFSLRYRDASTGALLPGAPSEVGSYTVEVVANDNTLTDYFSDDLHPIAKDTVIGSASFKISYVNLYLYNALLDESGSNGSAIGGTGTLLLPDTGAYDFYSDIAGAGQTSLYLGGTLVDPSKYTVVVQYKTGAVFGDVAEIDKVGTYRLKLTIDSSVDLSCTSADSLEKNGDDSIYYREFSVTCETFTFTLGSFSVYEGAARDVTLDSGSKTKLASIAGANYETVLLYYPYQDGVARVVAPDGSDSDLYHPTEVGSYRYRVLFSADATTYGVKAGDYVDLSFEIEEIPYVVSYYLDDGTEIDYRILYDGDAALNLNPVFYDRAGKEIGTVYTDVGSKKYSVTYQFFNGAIWVDDATPKAVGRYKAIITFNSVALVGSYPIPNVIEKEFQINAGTLSVETTRPYYYLAVGSETIPAFSFTSAAGDERANIGTPTVTYYNADGSLYNDGTVAPTGVGEYIYEVTINETIERLSVSAGAKYRGTFSIVYRPVTVTVDDDAIVFIDALTEQELLKTADGADPDYQIVYYVKSGNIYKRLAEKPTEKGEYLKQVIVQKACVKYRLAVGDSYSYSYTILGSSALIGITNSPDLTYDGGVKVPSISFSRDAAPLSLTPLTDYQVAYYHLVGSTYVPCDAPILAGDYRCVVTYLKTDLSKGITCGVYERSTFHIAAAHYAVTFTISEDSVDLVYDAKEKTYDVAFTYKSRPITVASTVKYASGVGEYDVAPFIIVGDYHAKVFLADDKSGSLTLDNGTIDFSIVRLSLRAKFIVPLGYNRMWVSDLTIVSPTLEYTCLNGRYQGNSYSSAALVAAPYGIDLDEQISYYYSADGIHYDIPRDPTTPGDYSENLSLDNVNVMLTTVESVGDDESMVSSPSLNAGVASQTFKVTPREVSVAYTYDREKDSLYYTGDTDGDRKGVASVSFMAYKDQATGYSDDVSAKFVGDYKIYYFISEYNGTVISVTKTLDRPYEKSYYVARVEMEPDGSNDEYLSRYTFKNGKSHDEPLEESPLIAGCYVDDIFRIKDQNKLDVVYRMPDTFAMNDEYKTISVDFYNNNAKVTDLIAGVDKDYKITYLDANDAENTTSYSAVGTYRVRITFLKDNVAYRLENYAGEYSGNKNYIQEGDTLTYTFEIFARRAMTVSLVAPDSFYFDGTVKSYSARFTVTEDSTECAVTLTEGTHYRLRYYSVGEDSFTLMNDLPTVPGDYAVECIFLKDLLDYTYEGKTILKDSFYSITENASEGKVATERADFTISKAILLVGGVKATDKSFDGTVNATFDETKKTISVYEEDGKACGRNVHNIKASMLEGSLSGTFDSQFPSGDDITVALSDDGKYALPEEYRAYYELKYPTYTARINKATIDVLLTDDSIKREYNPYAIESTIDFSLSYDEAFLKAVFPDLVLTDSNLTVGILSYEKGVNNGNSIGKYPIVLNTLALNDSAEGASYLGHSFSSLFELSLEKESYYEITARSITISVKEGQSKVYGDPNPVYGVSIGRLIYGDSASYTVTRASGENAGSYLISLSNVKILGGNGEDVSANYSITTKSAYFTIEKRILGITPKDQSATYLAGFSHVSPATIMDLSEKKDATEKYLDKPPVGGDRLSGKLSYVATDDPLKFRITQGTMTAVVNAMGKNVSSNYIIIFSDEPKYYTVTTVNIVVKLKEDVVLQKYYGDKEPIIAFTIEKQESDKLDRLELVSSSSVGRAPGETVGEYILLADNSAKTFLVYDEGIDVTQYFTFSVRQKVDGNWRSLETSDTKFKILPRPVIVTVEDASYENTGREIIPVLKYLNANGSRLSATLSTDLESKVAISVPSVEYHDGENLVTPVVEGSDPNYSITLQAGHVTVVYLQNVLTVNPVDSNDEVYSGRKFMLSGIMLYKTIRFYKIETANGEQPSHSLEISLPVDKDIAGDGLVVVALRPNGESKAFSFAQSGYNVVYEDDTAYYVAIAEVQEWFYLIWGVVIIIALVALYFLVRLIMFIAKKVKAKRAARVGAAAAGRGPSQGGGFVATPTNATATDSDSLFSDTAVTDTPTRTSTPIEPIDVGGTTASDDFFTDVAPTDATATQPAPQAEPVATDTPVVTAEPSSDSLISDTPISLSDDPITTTTTPEPTVTPTPAPEPTPVPDPTPEPAQPRGKKKKKKKESQPDPNQPRGFMPTAFRPRGDRSAAYAPTRSFTEDLFVEEQAAASDATSDSVISDDVLSDGVIVAPTTTTTPTTQDGDDELIISRGGGFSLSDDDVDDPDGQPRDEDNA